jgi:hypothetical protein
MGHELPPRSMIGAAERVLITDTMTRDWFSLEYGNVVVEKVWPPEEGLSEGSGKIYDAVVAVP